MPPERRVKSLDENSPMRTSALVRADNIMDMVKAFRESTGDDSNN